MDLNILLIVFYLKTITLDINSYSQAHLAYFIFDLHYNLFYKSIN